MKILIADALPGEIRVELANLGFEVDFRPKLTADTLPAEIGGAHVLVVRSTKVTAEAIGAGDRLQLIIRAGAGTNTIDCEFAARSGVYVANTPGKNSLAVAELTLGLILALDRRIPDNVADFKQGIWAKKVYSKGCRGLHGRTLGVVGLGRIGAAVAQRALGFGMKCLAWDRMLRSGVYPKLPGVEVCNDLLELSSLADVICVHLPLTPETRHIVGAEELAAMRHGAFLVNMSRGGVVDDEALAAAITEGRIRAACDVYENEPGAGDSSVSGPLVGLEGFYGTHHIGASTEQAQRAVADEVLSILRGWLRTGEVTNCVNLSSGTPTAGQLIVRHLDRVGVLAGVLDVLKRADVNVQEMTNTIFSGAIAASAKLSLESAPSPAVVAQLEQAEHVLGVEYISA